MNNSGEDLSPFSIWKARFVFAKYWCFGTFISVFHNLTISNNKNERITMNNIKNLTSLFLSQSYMDAWEDYKRALTRPGFACWDYVILTASNEQQAMGILM